MGAGGSFKWMRDTLFADKKQELAEKGGDVYAYMDALAEAEPAGSEGLCFLPYPGEEARKALFGGRSRRMCITLR